LPGANGEAGLPGGRADVLVNRPAATAPGQPAAPGDTALARFAADWVSAGGLPQMAIVLVDDGTLAGAPAAVAALPIPVTIAIEPGSPGAAAAMAAYRAAGIEVMAVSRLPAGATFRDKDGHERTATRVKWYEPPGGHTYRTYAMASEPIPSDEPLPAEVHQAAVPYPETEKPVFVGHYWLSGSRPELLRRNIACVDWSVAKGGFLCAYRWDGEQELDTGKFVWAA
jgi:hypothetical protein